MDKDKIISTAKKSALVWIGTNYMLVSGSPKEKSALPAGIIGMADSFLTPALLNQIKGLSEEDFPVDDFILISAIRFGIIAGVYQFYLNKVPSLNTLIVLSSFLEYSNKF